MMAVSPSKSGNKIFKSKEDVKPDELRQSVWFAVDNFILYMSNISLHELDPTAFSLITNQ